ncbi:hypothetical protein F5B19DRAFT_457662 [Rostrohypoxylon terebratum]|nr:hypothetical protein F5B19DRAFT_457662 [Rostrohypoxylon terebratum]
MPRSSFRHEITNAFRPIARVFRNRSNASNAVNQASDQPQQLADAPNRSSIRSGEAHHSPGVPAKDRDKNGLFCLHNPGGDFNVDIVAVHGLSGDSEETWTDDKTNKLWLRDFLPSQFPGVPIRVWSFGYDASVFGKAVIDIEDVATSLVAGLDGERQGTHSTKPIIFVAHSLGGIIVKKALILANERSDIWGDIRDSTHGAIFLVSPIGEQV